MGLFSCPHLWPPTPNPVTTGGVAGEGVEEGGNGFNFPNSGQNASPSPSFRKLGETLAPSPAKSGYNADNRKNQVVGASYLDEVLQ